jgi:transcriptional regulator with XRE-family HTH domain
MVTGEQIKAARALLRWTVKDLADRAGVSVPTIQRMEAARGAPSTLAQTAGRVIRAFEDAGISFYVFKRGEDWFSAVAVKCDERPTWEDGRTLGTGGTDFG